MRSLRRPKRVATESGDRRHRRPRCRRGGGIRLALAPALSASAEAGLELVGSEARSVASLGDRQQRFAFPTGRVLTAPMIVAVTPTPFRELDVQVILALAAPDPSLPSRLAERIAAVLRAHGVADPPV